MSKNSSYGVKNVQGTKISTQNQGKNQFIDVRVLGIFDKLIRVY